MPTSRLWQYCLIAIGSASSFVYPHAPLVSFATVAGVSLSRRQAMVAAVSIWLINQVCGFTVRQYPLSAIALLWGVTMGLGTVVVTLIASIQPKFSRGSGVGQTLWVGMALLLGFVVYQSSIVLVNQWVGIHGLTPAVFLQIFGRDLVWAIALWSLHTVLFNQQRLRQNQR
jgi:hypothetical protein